MLSTQVKMLAMLAGIFPALVPEEKPHLYRRILAGKNSLLQSLHHPLLLEMMAYQPHFPVMLAAQPVTPEVLAQQTSLAEPAGKKEKMKCLAELVNFSPRVKCQRLTLHSAGQNLLAELAGPPLVIVIAELSAYKLRLPL